MHVHFALLVSLYLQQEMMKLQIVLIVILVRVSIKHFQGAVHARRATTAPPENMSLHRVPRTRTPSAARHVLQVNFESERREPRPAARRGPHAPPDNFSRTRAPRPQTAIVRLAHRVSSSLRPATPPRAA